MWFFWFGYLNCVTLCLHLKVKSFLHTGKSDENTIKTDSIRHDVGQGQADQGRNCEAQAAGHTWVILLTGLLDGGRVHSLCFPPACLPSYWYQNLLLPDSSASLPCWNSWTEQLQLPGLSFERYSLLGWLALSQRSSSTRTSDMPVCVYPFTLLVLYLFKRTG